MRSLWGARRSAVTRAQLAMGYGLDQPWAITEYQKVCYATTYQECNYKLMSTRIADIKI